VATSDDELFRAAMSDVAPLKVAPKPPAARKAPSADQLARRAHAASDKTVAIDPNYLTPGEVKQLTPHELVSWKKDGVQDGVFKKLRLGKYPLDGTLDLHRKTVKEARVEMFNFIRMALAKGWRCVLINHGRGERSPTPARVKSYVIHWLGQIPEVLAFHHPERSHGGAGAIFVLLKKSAKQRAETRELHGQKGEE
jgi:DNA-nicking Smr family endonuclease